MIWNYSRFKIFLLGVIGSFFTVSTTTNILNVHDYFTPFEIITLLLLSMTLFMISLFLVFYGIEELMFDLRWGKDARKNIPVLEKED
jgi:hypothetical protein